MKLVTHSGNAHCDDLFAYTILAGVYPDHELIRTRETSIICGGRDTIVFDVGGNFDHTKDQYDHHQLDKQLREDGVPYSSVGLIWKYFGVYYLKNIGIKSSLIEKTHKQVDKSFIYFIDLADNGVPDHKDSVSTSHQASFSNVVEYMLGSGKDEDFVEASKFASKILIGVCQSAEKIAADKDKVLSLVSEKEYLVMPKRGMKYLETVLDHSYCDHIKFVIYPLPDDKFGCSTVRKNLNTFAARSEFPKKFGGLSEKDLVLATGIEQLTFCHTGGFFAASKSLESMIEFVEKTISGSFN